MKNRVVLFGAGGWGKNHLRILSELDVLVAVCDPSEEIKKNLEQDYKGIFAYSSIEETLRMEKFDTAFVCTPTKTHFEITSKLIESGKNVFVEKPLTSNSDESRQLIKLAKEKKIVLTCGYIERFNPAVQQVKKIINNNSLGNLLQIEFHRENKLDHDMGIGIIYDTSVHDIDTANYLFDELPHTVFASSGKVNHSNEDHATLMLKYSNGKIAVINSNWITPNRVRSFKAIFTDGIISGNFLTQEITISIHDETKTPRIEKQEPLLLEIKSFLSAVNGTSDLVVKPIEALAVTQIAESSILSSKNNLPIQLEFEKPIEVKV